MAGLEMTLETAPHPTGPLLVSLIVPVYNAADYLPQALESILAQTYRPLEIVFCDDSSRDCSLSLVEGWAAKLEGTPQMTVKVYISERNMGPGSARNRAIEISTGDLVAHFDADDIMHPERLQAQVDLYVSLPTDVRDTYLLGTGFDREPLGSTPYYTDWLNGMTEEDLHLHQYRECTIICPTWLYSRAIFDRIAGHRRAGDTYGNKSAFVDSSPETLEQEGISRVPEDLYFFLDHLLLGGRLSRVPRSLLTYRYTLNGWTLGSKKADLQKVRARYLEAMVLSKWPAFQIWGYGKDGRKFIKFLTAQTACKITGFLDVDEKKILQISKYYCAESGKTVPIRHFTQSTGDPIIVCVASKRAGCGDLEANIASLGLKEGVDFYHFA